MAEQPERAPRSSGALTRNHLEHAAVAAVLLGVVAAYLSTAARHVLGHDHGEYVTTGTEGGVPHPPGYPAYVLLLRLTSWLPADSPVHRTSLATATLGLATALVLYLACRRWHASSAAAACAAALFALSPRAWLLTTHAENLALNSLLAALVLLVVAPGTSLSPTRRAGALGLLAGLGACNHHSLALLLPLFCWGAFRALRSPPTRLRALGAALAGAALGLAPLAYAWHVARHAAGRWVWGGPELAHNVLENLLRAEYGLLRLAPQLDAPVAPLAERAAAFASRVSSDLLWAPALVALVALAWGSVAALRARRRMHGPWVLALSFVLAGPAFVLLNQSEPRAFDGALVARFDVLPELVLCVFLARGLHQLLLRVRMRVVALALPLALAGVAALFSLPRVREYHRPTVELYLQNTLNALPPDAVVLGGDDLHLFGFLYLQRIQHMRPDVVHIASPMLFRAWYKQRVQQRLGIPLDAVTPGGIRMGALAEALLSTGRPLFLLDVDTNYDAVLSALPNHPFGTVVRVLPRGQRVPAAEELEGETRALLARYRLEDDPPEPGSFGARVYRDYARPWHYLAAEYREQGKTDRAAAAQQMAELLEGQ